MPASLEVLEIEESHPMLNPALGCKKRSKSLFLLDMYFSSFNEVGPHLTICFSFDFQVSEKSTGMEITEYVSPFPLLEPQWRRRKGR